MQAPGASPEKVVVERSDVVGVRLEADPSSPVGDDPHGDLLLAHAPVFILFPDAEADAPRPFPRGGHDYHPRAVGSFLTTAHPFMAAPRGALAGILVILVCALMISGATLILLALAGQQGIQAWPIAVLAVGMGGLWLWVFGTHPIRLTGLIDRVIADQRSDDLGLRGSRFTPPRNKEWAEAAWRRYHEDVVRTNTIPRTSYVRSVEDEGDLFLQYWQFYPFNDWHNAHEADWEFVCLRLHERSEGVWQPRAAAYSSHLGGQWRTWDDVLCSDTTHPLVYVAQGSHAQYFEPKLEGYPAVLSQPWDLLAVSGRFTVRSDRVDRVICETGGEPIPYTLTVLPAAASGSRSVWWLDYAGLWGARDGVRGPRFSETKWAHPWSWVADMCVGDPGAWWGPQADPCVEKPA